MVVLYTMINFEACCKYFTSSRKAEFGNNLLLKYGRVQENVILSHVCFERPSRAEKGTELQLAFLNLQTILGTAVDVNGAAQMNSIHHLPHMS